MLLIILKQIKIHKIKPTKKQPSGTKKQLGRLPAYHTAQRTPLCPLAAKNRVSWVVKFSLQFIQRHGTDYYQEPTFQNRGPALMSSVGNLWDGEQSKVREMMMARMTSPISKCVRWAHGMPAIIVKHLSHATSLNLYSSPKKYDDHPCFITEKAVGQLAQSLLIGEEQDSNWTHAAVSGEKVLASLGCKNGVTWWENWFCCFPDVWGSG